MMKTKTFLALVTLLASCWSAQAQEQWSLERCIDEAIANNLGVRLQALGVQSDKANWEQSKLERLTPNLNGSASHGYNWGRSINQFDNTIVTERIQTNNFSLRSDITLFNGQRQINTIKQNRARLNASESALENAKYDLSLSVASAYLQVMFSEELLGNAERQVANTREQTERTQALVDAGALPRNDLLQLQSQLASDELSVVNAQNNLNLAYLSLKQLMLVPASRPIEIEVPELPDPDLGGPADSPEEAYRAAETVVPNVENARQNVEAARYGVELAKGQRYPTLSLVGQVFTQYTSGNDQIPDGNIIYDTPRVDPIPTLYAEAQDGTQLTIFNQSFSEPRIRKLDYWGQLEESYRPSVSFNLSIPIYNRGQVTNGIKQAEIGLKQAELQQRQTMLDLRQTIEQAYTDAVAAAKTFEATQRANVALEESFRISKEQFEAGTLNAVDYNIASNNLNNSRSDLIRSKYDYIFRLKVIDFYMGKPITLD